MRIGREKTEEVRREREEGRQRTSGGDKKAAIINAITYAKFLLSINQLVVINLKSTNNITYIGNWKTIPNKVNSLITKDTYWFILGCNSTFKFWKVTSKLKKKFQAIGKII